MTRGNPTDLVVCRPKFEQLEQRLLLDGADPRVTAMTPDPGSTAGSATSVVIEFDAELDPATIHADSFTLWTSGFDGTFDEGNEIRVPGEATYDAEAGMATLTPAGLLGWETYQVRLDAAVIADLEGDLLDGEYDPETFPPSGDALPGGDFLATFKVNMAQVSGNYTTDVTWAAGVFYLYNDVVVHGGATLTLLPGVVVKGRYHDDSYYDSNDMASEIGVSGTLIAEGTEDHPVVFTSIKDDWRGGDTNGDGTGTMPSGGDPLCRMPQRGPRIVLRGHGLRLRHSHDQEHPDQRRRVGGDPHGAPG